MKNASILPAIILAFIATTFSSCEVIGGIFKAGMGFGIFMVILVVAVIAFVVAKMGSK